MCCSCKNCRNTHRHVMVCLKTCMNSNPVTFQAVNKYKTGANWSPGLPGSWLYVPPAAGAFLPPRISPDKICLQNAQNHRALASSTGREGQLTGRLEQRKRSCSHLHACSCCSALSSTGKTGFFSLQKLHYKKYSKCFSAGAIETWESTLMLLPY